MFAWLAALLMSVTTAQGVEIPVPRLSGTSLDCSPLEEFSDAIREAEKAGDDAVEVGTKSGVAAELLTLKQSDASAFEALVDNAIYASMSCQTAEAMTPGNAYYCHLGHSWAPAAALCWGFQMPLWMGEAKKGCVGPSEWKSVCEKARQTAYKAHFKLFKRWLDRNKGKTRPSCGSSAASELEEAFCAAARGRSALCRDMQGSQFRGLSKIKEACFALANKDVDECTEALPDAAVDIDDKEAKLLCTNWIR